MCPHKNKIACKLLIYRQLLIDFVVWGGIEPPTQGFSVLCSTDWATAPSLLRAAKIRFPSGKVKSFLAPLYLANHLFGHSFSYSLWVSVFVSVRNLIYPYFIKLIMLFCHFKWRLLQLIPVHEQLHKIPSWQGICLFLYFYTARVVFNKQLFFDLQTFC